MSRLIDRIIADCQRPHLSTFLEQMDADYDELSASERRSIAGIMCDEEDFDPSTLIGLPVFAADDVGHYCSSLPEGTNAADVVASMAPPFDEFFIEFQRVPQFNPREFQLHAWGTRVNVEDDPKIIATMGRNTVEGAVGQPRWILQLDTFIEKKKGQPCGPVAHHLIGLAEDGTWWKNDDDGKNLWTGRILKFLPNPPDYSMEIFRGRINTLIFPVLLTLSFLHCKNVELRQVDQPDKVSRKHRKRHGYDLARYHVLDIHPLRKLLDRHRKGSRDDLRRALHICRGHFKTFTTDAPLLGRTTGTFWWGPQVRGSKSEGVILKDYRVDAPSEFGRAYREADESLRDANKEAPPSKDPDTAGRGLVAHSRTQNQIAETVRELRWIPRSPAQGEPEFDLAWKAQETLFVCEVKSLTPANEERQLRMATGQVIRYRQKMNARGHEPVVAVIATETKPADSTWDELCAKEGIVLIWPESAKDRLTHAATGTT